MVTEKWAEHIVKTCFEHFDPETVDQAKNRIIGTVGCTIGGANASGNSTLLNLIKEELQQVSDQFGDKRRTTIIEQELQD